MLISFYIFTSYYRNNVSASYEFTETTAVLIGPVQVQARWGPSTDWEWKVNMGAPPLTKELVGIGSCWQRENQFPPNECHWVYQPFSRADPMSRSSWPTQNSMILWGFFDSLFHFVLFGHCFVLLFFCLIFIFVCFFV